MTATMEREPADSEHGANGDAQKGANQRDDFDEPNASSENNNACDGEQGCGVDPNFLKRKQRRNSQSNEHVDAAEIGCETRRRIVKNAKVLMVVGLALAWMVELGGEVRSGLERNLERAFVNDSMKLDLQSGGTAIGVYPSSQSDILSRWGGVVQNDQRKWREEDSARTFNWIVLVALSAGVGYLFLAPKGRQVVEDYIESGVSEQTIKWS